jgi:NAD(P)-dependent dehydrogenase (short-subunit alcohol dehydrogenase family)
MRRGILRVVALKGRVAVVTGNTPVALGVARALGKQGASVAIAGWSQGGGEAAAKEIGAAGGTAQFVGTDVSRTLDIRRLASRVESDLGRVTVLVNAAEVLGLRAPLLELYEDEFDDLVAVNLRGAFLLARTFVPGMVQAGGGHLVNVVSTSGGGPGSGGHSASRAGLVPLTLSMAAELRACSVRVNAVDVGDPTAYAGHTGSRGAGELPQAESGAERHPTESVVGAVVGLCDCAPEVTGRIVRPSK